MCMTSVVGGRLRRRVVCAIVVCLQDGHVHVTFSVLQYFFRPEARGVEESCFAVGKLLIGRSRVLISLWAVDSRLQFPHWVVRSSVAVKVDVRGLVRCAGLPMC